MNLNNNPANDPWRNGMTDDQLMNLGWGGDIRGAIIQGLVEDAFKGRPAYLQNLDSNPANDPWRNGMTDYSLMNLGWGGDIRGAIIQGLVEDAFKGRPAY